MAIPEELREQLESVQIKDDEPAEEGGVAQYLAEDEEPEAEAAGGDEDAALEAEAEEEAGAETAAEEEPAAEEPTYTEEEWEAIEKEWAKRHGWEDQRPVGKKRFDQLMRRVDGSRAEARQLAAALEEQQGQNATVLEEVKAIQKALAEQKPAAEEVEETEVETLARLTTEGVKGEIQPEIDGIKEGLAEEKRARDRAARRALPRLHRPGSRTGAEGTSRLQRGVETCGRCEV